MDRINNYRFEKLKSGKANNVKDFFEKLIKPQFDNIETIKNTHNSLIDYLTIENPIFFLRLYGSYSKDKYDLLRRGFLSEYPDGTKVAFCDNTFSMLFTGLKIANISYNKYALREYLSQKNLVTSFGQTSKEKELSYYSPQNALKVNLNSKGWYLAHIKPTGYGFENLDLKSLFPNPSRDEWDFNRKIRYVESNLNKEQIKILHAHFIRLIHPFNSFLVPKRNHICYSGNNLGEEVELLCLVKDYVFKKYPKEFEEFEKITLKYNFYESTSKIGNIEWFENQNYNKIDNKEKIVVREKRYSIEREKEVEEYQSVEVLDKWLKSIGKEVFVEILYPEININPNISYIEIAQKYEQYSLFSLNSQKSRISTAKSIFRNGLENEALQIIIDSSKLNDNVREKALNFLKENK